MTTPATVETPTAPPTSPLRPARAPREDIRSPRRGRGQGDRARGDRARGGQPRGRGRGGVEHQPQRQIANFQQRAKSNTASQPTESSDETSTLQNGQEQATAEDAAADAGEAVEAEVCFICASPVIHNAVAPCNHRTCHICALRLRALYKTKACAHCRTNAEFVIFTDDSEKRFEDFVDSDFAKTDSGLGVNYEKNEIFEDTVLLLRYNCPEPSCDIACYGWPDLHRHVKSAHHRIMCDLCTRNKKVFTHEHELFTQAELRKHEKFGDDNPGAVDQSGFKGHPDCGFCRQRFYGDDELYVHCRDKHEKCHICDRTQPGQQQQYYLDYGQLEVHFRKDHFLCIDQECLDKKFVVFESEMDLKAHQLEVHPNGLSKDARRDARRVDMSSFDYRSAHQEPRGGRREGRGRGRGRDPNVDPLPVSSAQPMRRDEMAYQRQLAIHSAQSISNRTFGGQLTSSDTSGARAPTTTNEPATVTARPSSSATNNLPSSIDNLSLNHDVTTARSLSPNSRARALRHSAVQERASNLLGNDAASMTNFRNTISSYRSSSITATELIDSFFTIFDSRKTSNKEIGTLIKELADIFEIPGKKEALLKAWNDWRAINEDYPSLPGADNASSSAIAGASGKRILKLKSSTAQSSRSAVSRSGSWGGAGPAAASAGNPFPPMPLASKARNQPSKVPWVTPASAIRGPTAPTLSSASRAAPASSSKPPAADAFPALPLAQKPGMNVSRPGYLGNPRLQRGSGTNTPVTAWGAGGLPTNGELEQAVQASMNEDEAGGTSGKGKGKGKAKKVYMHWG